MIRKEITYNDYNGNERKESFYFNLNKAELIEMQFSVDGGLQKLLEEAAATQDNRKFISFIKDFILRSYGIKSPDGQRFIKSQELADNFSQTEAYSELFLELATNEKAAGAFIMGVIPQQMAAELAAHPELMPPQA